MVNNVYHLGSIYITMCTGGHQEVCFNMGVTMSTCIRKLSLQVVLFLPRLPVTIYHLAIVKLTVSTTLACYNHQHQTLCYMTYYWSIVPTPTEHQHFPFCCLPAQKSFTLQRTRCQRPHARAWRAVKRLCLYLFYRPWAQNSV